MVRRKSILRRLRDIFNLDGKVTIVTGGLSGAGEAIVYGLCVCGATVVIADDNEEKGKLLVKDLKDHSYKADFIQTDIKKIITVDNLMREVVSRYGRIDILVNNANTSAQATIDQISDEEWDQVGTLDVTGTFHCLRGVVPYMRKQKSGKIINVVSVDGKVGLKSAGVHHSAASGAILAMTRQLANQEANDGIRVNAVACGILEEKEPSRKYMETEEEIISRIPAKRMGRPEEAASAVVFLASDSANFITGETIDVNGGLYMA